MEAGVTPACNIAYADAGAIAPIDAGAASEDGGLSGNTPGRDWGGGSDASMPASRDA